MCSVPRCAERLPEYLEAMKAMGRKPLTIRNMAAAVRRCSAILEARSPGISLEEVGTVDVIALQQALLCRHKESSSRLYIQLWGAFAMWSTGIDPVKKAKLLWNARSDVDRIWITADDYRVVYSSAEPRERVMLALGATMGLRRGEMASLTMGQIQDGKIEIHGKGHGPLGKVETRPMSDAVRKALEEWLPERERILAKHGEHCDRVLVSYCGKPIGEDSVGNAVRRLGSSCGIRLTTHSLRRLYAVTMDEAGMDLETIARMMRHASPYTTYSCYLKEDLRKMTEAVRAVDAALAL